jgi:hypothetical protein
MVRLLIATYIIVVLVFSAKAKAMMSVESNPALNVLNHPAKVTEELKVQDPLPDFNSTNDRQMNFLVSENSVG